MPKKGLTQIDWGAAWILATVFGYLVGSIWGYGSYMLFVVLLCPFIYDNFIYPEFDDLNCAIACLAPAVWVAGIFIGIVQLLAWNNLVWLSRRWISTYALVWTGIMLLVFLWWIAIWIKVIPINLGQIIILIFGLALFYPAIAGAVLLFNSPTKGKAQRR